MIRCEVFLCVDGAAAGANGGDSALHGAMLSLSSVLQLVSTCPHSRHRRSGSQDDRGV